MVFKHSNKCSIIQIQIADMSKTIDSTEDEILPPLRTRDPYSTSRARMKPKQRVKSRYEPWYEL